jgi:hypothetical protein
VLSPTASTTTTITSIHALIVRNAGVMAAALCCHDSPSMQRRCSNETDAHHQCRADHQATVLRIGQHIWA